MLGAKTRRCRSTINECARVSFFVIRIASCAHNYCCRAPSESIDASPSIESAQMPQEVRFRVFNMHVKTATCRATKSIALLCSRPKRSGSCATRSRVFDRNATPRTRHRRSRSSVFSAAAKTRSTSKFNVFDAENAHFFAYICFSLQIDAAFLLCALACPLARATRTNARKGAFVCCLFIRLTSFLRSSVETDLRRSCSQSSAGSMEMRPFTSISAWNVRFSSFCSSRRRRITSVVLFTSSTSAFNVL